MRPLLSNNDMEKTMSTTATEDTFKSTGGVNIFFRSWRPAATPRAVVVICHGVNSHGGQYEWVGQELAKSDLSVYALDLRGRGKSDGERFYVDDVSEYVSDVSGLIQLAKQREPGLPVFL